VWYMLSLSTVPVQRLCSAIKLMSRSLRTALAREPQLFTLGDHSRLLSSELWTSLQLASSSLSIRTTLLSLTLVTSLLALPPGLLTVSLPFLAHFLASFSFLSSLDSTLKCGEKQWQLWPH
jgi:hypothetical protein